MDAKINVNDLR